MNRKSISRGETRISKSCCATCTEGLPTLKDVGYDYTVNPSHGKPYLTRLTDFLEVDQAIIKRMKIDFESWLRRIIIESDSDVTDHETAVPYSADEEEPR